MIALAGAVSLFVGTLTALKQDDIKRLMSFHVIGQVGYMFLGIGLGLFFLPSSPTLAALGLLAGTFHMINHSLYKSCLFLGSRGRYASGPAPGASPRSGVCGRSCRPPRCAR